MGESSNTERRNEAVGVAELGRVPTDGRNLTVQTPKPSGVLPEATMPPAVTTKNDNLQQINHQQTPKTFVPLQFEQPHQGTFEGTPQTPLTSPSVPVIDVRFGGLHQAPKDLMPTVTPPPTGGMTTSVDLPLTVPIRSPSVVTLEFASPPAVPQLPSVAPTPTATTSEHSLPEQSLPPSVRTQTLPAVSEPPSHTTLNSLRPVVEGTAVWNSEQFLKTEKVTINRKANSYPVSTIKSY